MLLLGDPIVGDAAAADVKSPRTFSSVTVGSGATGTMTDRGSVTETLTNEGQAYTVTQGYHAGAGTVTATITNLVAGNIKDGATVGGVAGSYSDMLAGEVPAAGDIISGKSAFENGNTKISGTMVDRGTVNITPSTSNQAITAGRHSGSGVVYGDADLVVGNIKSGITIFGVAGTVPPAPTNFFGDGSDGAFNSVGNVTESVTADTGLKVLQVTSYTLNAGHTHTTDNRCRGLIIFSQGNVQIDGTLHMDSKAAATAATVVPHIVAKVKPDGLYHPGLTTAIAGALGEFLLFGYVGGGGGRGGYGGIAASGGMGTLPSVEIPKGGMGGLPLPFGGGRGGGGAGGCSRIAQSWANIRGGSGGDGGSSETVMAGGTAVSQAVSGATAGNNGVTGGSGASGSAARSSQPAVFTNTSGAGGDGPGGGGGGATTDDWSGVSGVTATSGGAGSAWGGGLILIIAGGNVTIGAAGIVRSQGGSGGAGGNGALSPDSAYYAYTGGSGGGGGGGGIIAIYRSGTYTNNGSVSAPGGAGGAAGSGGVAGNSSIISAEAGQAGSSGTILTAQIT